MRDAKYRGTRYEVAGGSHSLVIHWSLRREGGRGERGEGREREREQERKDAKQERREEGGRRKEEGGGRDEERGEAGGESHSSMSHDASIGGMFVLSSHQFGVWSIAFPKLRLRCYKLCYHFLDCSSEARALGR